MKIFAVVLLTMLFILMTGCPSSSKEKPREDGANDFQTYKYDGHLWVVVKIGYGVGLEHHPDCPCKKTDGK